MATLQRLPAEILCMIAEITKTSEFDIRLSRPSPSHHASLARTSRRLHAILNPTLYKRNFEKAQYRPCIIWAAKHGRLDTMKTAHGFGADLNLSWFDATPLSLAARNGDRPMVEWLLDNGAAASVHVTSLSICGPVSRTMSLSDGQDYYYCDENPFGLRWARCPNNKRTYPLHTVLVHGGDPDIAAMLIRHGAYLLTEGRSSFCVAQCCSENDAVLFNRALELPELDVNLPDLQGQTALHLAIRKGHGSFVQALLLRRETDPTAADKSLLTPLHLAARKTIYLDRWEMPLVDWLLRRPINDANAQDSIGRTPLHCAAEAGQLAAAQSLLSRPGIDAGFPAVQGITPLHMAVYGGHLSIVLLLLKREDVDIASEDGDDRTVLHYCAEGATDNTAMISALEPYVRSSPRVRVDALSLHGTAFSMAIMVGHFGTAMALLDLGADPLNFPVDNEDLHNKGKPLSALHYSLRMSPPNMKSTQLTLVRKLLSRGCPVNRDSRAGTPLLFATMFARSVPCMRVLLEMGADPDALCTTGSLKMPLLSVVLEETVMILDTPDSDSEASVVETPDTIEAAGQRIGLLFQHGARLDTSKLSKSNINPPPPEYPMQPRKEHDDAETPLEWLYEMAYLGDHDDGHGFLELVLSKATRANISLEHLDQVIFFWGHYTTEDDCRGLTDYDGVQLYPPQSAEDNEEMMKVKRILVDFREREFPEHVAGGQKQTEQDAVEASSGGDSDDESLDSHDGDSDNESLDSYDGEWTSKWNRLYMAGLTEMAQRRYPQRFVPV